MKKKKSDGEKEDNSLKGIDVRTLHEAYQTLMKKYCPDSKKKPTENDDNNPTDDACVGMAAFWIIAYNSDHYLSRLISVENSVLLYVFLLYIPCQKAIKLV